MTLFTFRLRSMFIRFFSGGLVLCLTLYLASCGDALEVDIPSYLRIDSIRVEYDQPGTTGTGGTRITDAWIFVDGKTIGVFPLPATIPVPADRFSKVDIRAGIRVNGIAATRESYPFYRPWEETIRLTADSTYTLRPVVRYFNNLTFPWMEDFEDAGLSIDSSELSDVGIERFRLEDTHPIYGQFVGKVEITESTPGMKILTNDFYDLPLNGLSPAFLEMDYRCNQSFVVSVIIDPFSGVPYEEPWINLNPTPNNGGAWNKIYIDLTDLIERTPDAERFGLSFTANYSSANSTGEFYFDNLKFVHN